MFNGSINDYPLQYSCLGNCIDRGVWRAIVHGVTNSWTQLSTHNLAGINFIVWYGVKVKVKVTQVCLTLCDPIDYTVHGIFQARILEWVAIPFSRSSQPRDQTQISRIAGRSFTVWATREARCEWLPIVIGSFINYQTKAKFTAGTTQTTPSLIYYLESTQPWLWLWLEFHKMTEGKLFPLNRLLWALPGPEDMTLGTLGGRWINQKNIPTKRPWTFHHS